MTLSSNKLNLENKILRINSCESTNSYAKDLLSKSEPIEGTVVITDKQTKGRGQFGNSWSSEDYKNLTLSLILKPTFLTPSQQFIVSKITALACIHTLNKFSEEQFLIKWPNDIFHENKKIAGILIENSISSNKIIDTIIGVGININQNFSNKLKTATSLSNIIKAEKSLEIVLKTFLIIFEDLYTVLKNNRIEEINEEYKSLLLGINRKRVFIKVETNKEFEGTIKGVNSLGQLIISNQEIKKCYNLKEIKWVF